jgi:hypothetical protein
VLDVTTAVALGRLNDAGYLAAADFQRLGRALRVWHRIQSVQRVAFEAAEPSRTEEDLFDRVLARATRMRHPGRRAARLERMASEVMDCYEKLIASPARALADPPALSTEPLSP